MKTLHFMSPRTHDDWLAFSTENSLLLVGKANNTYALDADSGDQVWHNPVRGQQPLILSPDTFINQTGHTYEISTGKILGGNPLFRRGGCNYPIQTSFSMYYMLAAKDWHGTTKKQTVHEESNGEE